MKLFLNILGFVVVVILLLSYGVFVVKDCFDLIGAFSWRELLQAITNIIVLYVAYYSFYKGAKNVIE